METTTQPTVQIQFAPALIKGIHDRRVVDDQHIVDELVKMRMYQKSFNNRLAILESKVPAIVTALNDMGLGIESMGYGKNGAHDRKWIQGDAMRVTINATPIPGGKFKFITFKGYTAGGRGKNQKRLDDKADKMAATLKEKTELDASVNCYSLEIPRELQSKRIMIEMFIK